MMRCIAIDDEPLALDVIKNYMEKIPFAELSGIFGSAPDAAAYISAEEPDLIFLDIQMPEISGIQFLKSLANPPIVIFTTAYEKFALEGFELNVTDYLLKPFSFERFFKAVSKAHEIYSLKKSSIPDDEKDYFFVKSDYQQLKINFRDIIYVEGLKDYVKIFTGPKPILAHSNLKGMESKLPASKFLRVHKSYIISIEKIEAVQKSMIRVSGVEIPVGEMYKAVVEDLLKQK
ncbi:MAG: LytR/AlgR family response regulator transcription factor [Cytophagaceae bacterium]